MKKDNDLKLITTKEKTRKKHVERIKKKEPEKDKNKPLIKLIPIIAILIIVLLAIYIIFVYNNPSNRLKRVLERQGYSCTNYKCSKGGEYNYTINIQNAHFIVENDNYTLYLENKLPSLTINKKNKTCTYYLEGREFLTKVDKDYTYQPGCEDYIEFVNEMLSKYEDMLNEAKVNVNDF